MLTPRILEWIAHGINIASQHCMGDGVQGSGPLFSLQRSWQYCCSCFALAIFVPSTDSDIDVCTSYCSLNRICSLGLWLWDWGVGVGALGFGLRGVLASKLRRCGGFQGPFRGLFPLPLASVEGLFKHLSRTVRGLFRPLWHWPRTVFF